MSKFIPFYVGTWRVSLVGNDLYIGCQRFDASEGYAAIRKLCRVDMVLPFSVSGIEVTPGEIGVHTNRGIVLWKNLERILMALEEAGIR